VLLAGLSTGHMIGLAIVAAVFISFALASSFLAPRRWPDYPGRNGLSVFMIVAFLLFFAQLAAVEFFGVESESEAQAAAPEPVHGGRTIQVSETEYKIALPALQTLTKGSYTFVVYNAGQVAHNLVVVGPNAAGAKSTPLIPPGGTVRLTVALGSGSYALFCSVDSHRQLGMLAKLSVS
jgi:plastocyanin